MLFLLAVLLQPVALDAPASVLQGDTLRVRVNAPGADATSGRIRFAGREVRVFPNDRGSYLGLVPVPVDLAPGTHSLDWLNSAGQLGASRSVSVRDAQFPRQNITVSPRVQRLTPLPGEMETIHRLQETVTDRRFWHEPFSKPALGCRSSPFGVARYHNGRPTGSYHRGVDIRAPQGRPVHAVAAGTVRIARMYRLHGGTVGIDHGQGVVSLYIHFSRLAVKQGQQVQEGDIIGNVGSTGFATGPHLHWGLYVNGLPVNPAGWVGRTDPCR